MLRQMDIDVVWRVIGPIPGEIDVLIRFRGFGDPGRSPPAPAGRVVVSKRSRLSSCPMRTTSLPNTKEAPPWSA